MYTSNTRKSKQIRIRKDPRATSCALVVVPVPEAKLGAEGAELLGLELLELHAVGALAGHGRVVLVEEGGGGLGEHGRLGGERGERGRGVVVQPARTRNLISANEERNISAQSRGEDNEEGRTCTPPC